MNQHNSPVAEIARIAARIAGARATSNDELIELIASIGQGVQQIRGGGATENRVAPDERSAQEGSDIGTATGRTNARQGRRRQSSHSRSPHSWVPEDVNPSAVVARSDGDRPRAAAAPAARRSRRTLAADVAEPAAVAAPTPKLMRRADVRLTEDAVPFGGLPEETKLRGVVRWFDIRQKQGRLRLPGFDEVEIDAGALERAGIARLYKGQEVEATVERQSAGVRLTAISLPGQPSATPSFFDRTGGLRRHAKPVVIEMKRDSLRRAGARLEAEHLLGGRDPIE